MGRKRSNGGPTTNRLENGSERVPPLPSQLLQPEYLVADVLNPRQPDSPPDDAVVLGERVSEPSGPMLPPAAETLAPDENNNQVISQESADSEPRSLASLVAPISNEVQERTPRIPVPPQYLSASVPQFRMRNTFPENLQPPTNTLLDSTVVAREDSSNEDDGFVEVSDEEVEDSAGSEIATTPSAIEHDPLFNLSRQLYIWILEKKNLKKFVAAMNAAISSHYTQSQTGLFAMVTSSIGYEDQNRLLEIKKENAITDFIDMLKKDKGIWNDLHTKKIEKIVQAFEIDMDKILRDNRANNTAFDRAELSDAARDLLRVENGEHILDPQRDARDIFLSLKALLMTNRKGIQLARVVATQTTNMQHRSFETQTVEMPAPPSTAFR